MPFSRPAYLKYVAVTLAIAGICVYVWSRQSHVSAEDEGNRRSRKVVPGSNKAILMLGSESVVSLDTLSIGTTLMQGGTQLVKTDEGELLYSPVRSQDKNDGAVFMNTLKTPRGGKFQLTLPDGSGVWLNAASSITYPTAFKGLNRQVSISGEVYFEVTKDTSHPFIVKTSSEVITVRGTAFNVNAYPDEPNVKVSLVEGSVHVNRFVLQPGEGYNNGDRYPCNVQQDIAWTTGYFGFDHTDLMVAMRQLSRWYDVDVVYPDGAANQFITGKISRNLDANHLIPALKTLGINARIEDSRFVVTR